MINPNSVELGDSKILCGHLIIVGFTKKSWGQKTRRHIWKIWTLNSQNYKYKNEGFKGSLMCVVVVGIGSYVSINLTCILKC